MTNEEIHDIMSKHVDCDYKEGLAFARALLESATSRPLSDAVNELYEIASQWMSEEGRDKIDDWIEKYHSSLIGVSV